MACLRDRGAPCVEGREFPSCSAARRQLRGVAGRSRARPRALAATAIWSGRSQSGDAGGAGAVAAVRAGPRFRVAGSAVGNFSMRCSRRRLAGEAAMKRGESERSCAAARSPTFTAFLRFRRNPRRAYHSSVLWCRRATPSERVSPRSRRRIALVERSPTRDGGAPGGPPLRCAGGTIRGARGARRILLQAARLYSPTRCSPMRDGLRHQRWAASYRKPMCAGGGKSDFRNMNSAHDPGLHERTGARAVARRLEAAAAAGIVRYVNGRLRR